MPLRLAEAIRRGDKKPQTWNRIVEADDDGEICATCAIGGALLSAGTRFGDPKASSHHAFAKQQCLSIWPWLSVTTDCPACGQQFLDAFEIICYHIGAGCSEPLWSRQLIAEWVDTIEPRG